MRRHTIGCSYPEGCTCGATEWNNMKYKLEWYETRFSLLEANH